MTLREWKRREIVKAQEDIGTLEAKLLSAYNRLRALRGLRVRKPQPLVKKVLDSPISRV
jgi:hypothetical protein